MNNEIAKSSAKRALAIAYGNGRRESGTRAGGVTSADNEGAAADSSEAGASTVTVHCAAAAVADNRRLNSTIHRITQPA